MGLTVTGSDTSKYTLNTYDVFNQLVTTKDQDSESAFTYNGDGLRVGKTVTKDNTTTTTKFVYEYDKVVLELDGSGNQTAYNVYGGDMLISRTAGTTTLYYLYNGHGDVVNIADSTGSIVMTYDYDPFGVVTTATGNIANSYLYAGYQFDDETGLYYLNARYYDPVMARFISADTYTGKTSDPLSLNLYTYCSNEPMMYTDPTGHTPIGTPVTVTLPDGTTQTGYANNGVTTMEDGSRPQAGSTVTAGNTTYYVAADPNGVGGVSGIAIDSSNSAIGGAVVTQNGQTQTGDVINGSTYVNGSRVSPGSTVTVGNTSYTAVSDPNGIGGVSGVKSTADVETVDIYAYLSSGSTKQVMSLIYDGKEYQLYHPSLTPSSNIPGYEAPGSTNTTFDLNGYDVVYSIELTFNAFNAAKANSGGDSAADLVDSGPLMGGFLAAIDKLGKIAGAIQTFKLKITFYKEKNGKGRYVTMQLKNESDASILRDNAGKTIRANDPNSSAFVDFSFDKARASDQYLFYIVIPMVICQGI
ncbi:RHS repeat-associated core domain-containing protein [Oscillospiraceae bacterium WX1]